MIEKVYEDETFVGYIAKYELRRGFERYPAKDFMCYASLMVINKKTGAEHDAIGSLADRDGAIEAIKEKIRELRKKGIKEA